MENDDVPKPLRLLPDGRPLLVHVMDYYRASGVSEFVLCVGYGAQAIETALVNQFRVPSGAVHGGPGRRRFEAAGLRITLVDSGIEAGKCRRLLDARQHIGKQPFLLGYADVLSDFDLSSLVACHESSEGLLTVVATRVRSRYGELVVGQGTTVVGFQEKPLQPALISAGYFMCAPELFDLLSPDLDLEAQIFPKLVQQRALHAIVHDGLWLPFDTYKDFLEVEELAEKEGFPWLTAA
jgi:glucose-1-phosphate cytidylyltransferase